jgi:predicted ABC-type ATPase
LSSSKPTCVILAGTNGAGKSTVFSETNPPGIFVNADDIAREISPDNPESVSVEAGRRVISLLKRLMLDRESFTYETTLSSRQALNVMRQARSAGYQVELIFIALRSPELHVARVASRVAQGGHSIPRDVILRRYETSLNNLPVAVTLADYASVYDNSSASGARLMVSIENGIIVVDRLELKRGFDRRISALLNLSRSTPSGLPK